MRCPVVTDGVECGGHLRTIDSRESPRAGKRRRRECAAGHRTTWYEFQVDDVASADRIVQAILDVLRPRVFELIGDLSLTSGGGRRLLDPRGERLVAMVQDAIGELQIRGAGESAARIRLALEELIPIGNPLRNVPVDDGV